MTHTSKRDLICIILSFCILIVLIVASWFTAKEVVLSFTGIKTEGIVTTVESISGNRSNGGVTIQYSFTDHNNIQYTTTDIYTSNTTALFYQGQKVTVGYDKNDARNNVIVNGYLYVGLLLNIVLMFFVVVILSLFLRKGSA